MLLPWQVGKATNDKSIKLTKLLQSKSFELTTQSYWSNTPINQIKKSLS